jgi:hypothetical protein
MVENNTPDIEVIDETIQPTIPPIENTTPATESIDNTNSIFMDLAAELAKPTAKATSEETPIDLTPEEIENHSIFAPPPPPEIKPQPGTTQAVDEAIKSIVQNKGIISNMLVMALEGGMLYAFPRLYSKTLFSDEKTAEIQKLADTIKELQAKEEPSEKLTPLQIQFTKELATFNANSQKLQEYAQNVVPLKPDERELLVEYINTQVDTSKVLSLVEKNPALAIGLYIGVPRMIPMAIDYASTKFGAPTPPTIV